MSDIVLSTQNGQAVVSSREVAERFGKNHKDVFRAIENLAAQNCATKSFFTKPRLKTEESCTPCT